MKKLIKLFYLHCSCKGVVEISNKENVKESVIKSPTDSTTGIRVDRRVL